MLEFETGTICHQALPPLYAIIQVKQVHSVPLISFILSVESVPRTISTFNQPLSVLITNATRVFKP